MYWTFFRRNARSRRSHLEGTAFYLNCLKRNTAYRIGLRLDRRRFRFHGDRARYGRFQVTGLRRNADRIVRNGRRRSRDRVRLVVCRGCRRKSGSGQSR